jgi:hypothetical protein
MSSLPTSPLVSLDEYLHTVCMIDPEARKAWICTRNGMREAGDGVLHTEAPEIAVPLSGIFA